MIKRLFLLNILFLSCLQSTLSVSGEKEFLSNTQIKKSNNSLFFTSKELQWLDKKQPITYVYDPDWPPFEWTNGIQEHTGIIADILSIISDKTGIEFRPVHTKTWNDAVKLAKAHKVNMYSAVAVTEERKNYLNFTTENIYSYLTVFVSDIKNRDYTLDEFNRLEGKTIALIKGNLLSKTVKMNYPKAKYIYVDSTKEGFDKVTNKKADLFAINAATATYFINHKGYSEVKVYKKIDFKVNLKIALQKDVPKEVISILDKTIRSIGKEQLSDIFHKWTIGTEYQYENIIRWFLIICVFILVVVLLLLVWNRTLNKRVLQRTSELNARKRALQAEINERQKAEVTLQYHSKLLENVSDAVVSVDMNQRIISWNKAAENIYGWKSEEALGKFHRELTSMEYVGISREEVLNDIIHKGFWRGDVVQRRKDGQQIFVQSTPSLIKDKEGKNMGIVGVQRDMTEYRQAEEALRESEEKFRTLVTNTEEIVYMIDKKEVIILSEGKGLSKLGLNPGEVVGKSVFELYKDYPEILDKMRNVFDGETVTIEHHISDHYLKSWFTPHKNRTGDIIGLLGLSVNITEQKQAEAKNLEYQSRLKALASQLTLAEEKERSLLAVELHDNIGQSLVFSRIQLANLKGQISEDKVKGLIDEMSQSILHMIQTTKSLVFDLSSPLLHDIGLSAAIHQWLNEQICQKHGLKIEFIDDYNKNLKSKEMRTLLFRNVRELLINVVKHAHAKKVTVYLESDQDNIKITVQDDGSGFSADDKIVTSGSNFGLFSIQERMNDMGGQLKIESEPGTGCRAILIAPLSS